MLIIFKILFKKLKEKKNRENSEKHWVETLKGLGRILLKIRWLLKQCPIYKRKSIINPMAHVVLLNIQRLMIHISWLIRAWDTIVTTLWPFLLPGLLRLLLFFFFFLK